MCRPFVGDSNVLNQEGDCTKPDKEVVVGELDKKDVGEVRKEDRREDELLLADRVAITETVLTPALLGDPGPLAALGGIDDDDNSDPAVFARFRSVFCKMEGGFPTVLLGDDVDRSDGAPEELPRESEENRNVPLGSAAPNSSKPSLTFMSGVSGGFGLEYPDEEGGPARAAISAKKEKSKSSTAGGRPSCAVMVDAGE